jgi:hypothetical protein
MLRCTGLVRDRVRLEILSGVAVVAGDWCCVGLLVGEKKSLCWTEEDALTSVSMEDFEFLNRVCSVAVGDSGRRIR